ncbi:MAG: hypothetical protein LBK61_00700 [Spirochaetaceae bacterium]|jgi:hypothetical protein|nr:hypothetical protein [Spirochaetaceae bacterium]
MNEKEKELFDIFKGMSKETQNIYLSYGHFAVSAEQAMKRQYGLDAKEEPQDKGAA